MLAKETIKQIKKLELHAGHIVTEALAGTYLSAFKGKGMEFDTVREYIPGDDIRNIDWNVTARSQVPHVKILREEREMTVLLMVDVSPSQGFGTTSREKREIAAEFAAIVAFLAIRNQDNVGLIAFSDHIEAFIPPKKGRGHVWSIIRTILTHEGKGQTTDIAGALEYARRIQKRRSMCFLVSDFWAEQYEAPLSLLGRKHDLIAVSVQDPRESEVPDCGVIALQDKETGEFFHVDTGSSAWRRAYVQKAQERTGALQTLLRKQGVSHIELDTREPVVDPLVRFFRERQRRGRRR